MLCSEKVILKGGDAIKLFNAPGAAFTATVTTVNGPDSLSDVTGDGRPESLAGQDADPSNCDLLHQP